MSYHRSAGRLGWLPEYPVPPSSRPDRVSSIALDPMIEVSSLMGAKPGPQAETSAVGTGAIFA